MTSGDNTTGAQKIDTRRRVSLRGLVQVVVGLGALALVVMRSDARGLVEAIKHTHVSYLPFAALASLLVTWLMSYRWGVVLAARGHRLKTVRLFVYYLIGIFFMNFVPGGGVSGDLARLVYVSREVPDKPFVLSTLVYERMIGLFALLLTGLVALFASRDDLPSGRLFYFGEAFLAVAVFVFAMLMSDYVSSRLARLCRAAGSRLKMERVGQAAARVLESISEMRRHKAMIFATIFLSLAIRVAWSMGCYIVALAMGLPLSLPLVFAFISLVDVIRMLPISVGGLGIREWAIVVLFAKVGIGQEQALLFSFLAFAPVMLNAVAGGLLYIWRAGVLRAEQARASSRRGENSVAEVATKSLKA